MMGGNEGGGKGGVSFLLCLHSSGHPPSYSCARMLFATCARCGPWTTVVVPDTGSRRAAPALFGLRLRQILTLGSERFMVPEALFHPSDIGTPLGFRTPAPHSLWPMNEFEGEHTGRKISEGSIWAEGTYGGEYGQKESREMSIWAVINYRGACGRKALRGLTSLSTILLGGVEGLVGHPGFGFRFTIQGLGCGICGLGFVAPACNLRRPLPPLPGFCTLLVLLFCDSQH